MSAERLELDELVEYWTLLDGERELVAGKRGTTRLVFALMLKFYGRHGRFPDGDGDLPREVVEIVARQVRVAPADLRRYEFSGRTVEYHRAQIRGHFGFRECTVEDAQAIERWLAEHVARADPRQDVVREELLARCRRWRVEPPAEGRIDRIVRAAIHAVLPRGAGRDDSRPSPVRPGAGEAQDRRQQTPRRNDRAPPSPSAWVRVPASSSGLSPPSAWRRAPGRPWRSASGTATSLRAAIRNNLLSAGESPTAGIGISISTVPASRSTIRTGPRCSSTSIISWLEASINAVKVVIPSSRAHALITSSSSVPRPRRCQPSVTVTANSAASRRSVPRT